METTGEQVGKYMVKDSKEPNKTSRDVQAYKSGPRQAILGRGMRQTKDKEGTEQSSHETKYLESKEDDERRMAQQARPSAHKLQSA